MQQYKFPDWFSQNIPNFIEIRDHLPSRHRVLEIGCFEGRSTCWLLQNFLDPAGTICCVDTFAGSSEHTEMVLGDLKSRWQNNVEGVRGSGQTCRLYNQKSYDALAQIIVEKQSFDFIYVDGSHTAPDVLADACMCAGLLRVGGVILFDDYLWPMPGDHWPATLTELKTPKPAVNAFTNIYGELMRPVISNYQVAFIKIA